MEEAQKKIIHKKSKKAIIKKNVISWLIMLPSLALFLFFVWIPIMNSFGLSFFSDFDFKNFVGLQNYTDLFASSSFIAALKNTFLYILWSLVIGFLLPFFLGFFLSECFHLNGFFRIAIYLPCMISGIAVVFLFSNIYGDESYSILNVILKAFGGTERLWGSDPNLIIPLIVLAMTWKGAGGTALIYLSNFKQIDNSLYEASKMDGCSPFQRFIKITVPEMKSTILTLLILQIISVFQVFYEPLVIGNWGGPVNDASMSLLLLGYKYAFVDFEYGKAAASSIFLALIIIVFTIVYFAIVKALDREEK